MNEPRWAANADPDAVADHIANVIEGRERSFIAVPGGRTPAPVLAALVKRPLPWGGVEITLTDDRIVPADHPASNFGLLSRSLEGCRAKLTPLAERAEPGRFDLVWIGMGNDGHIASVFPNAMQALSTGTKVQRTTPDPLPPEAPFERLTLTLPALANAGEIILVARGAEKRRVLDAAIAGTSDLPVARLLSMAQGPVTIFWSET